MRKLTFLLILPVLVSCSVFEQSEARYNLVMVCADTVRADVFHDLNALQQGDALSAHYPDALDFRSAHAAAPWTIPSVASLFTGLYPAQHSAGRFPNQVANLAVEIPSGLNDDHHTLAEYLQEMGVEGHIFTAHPWFSEQFGLQQGFEHLDQRKGWHALVDLFQKQFLADASGKQKHKGGRNFYYLHFMESHDWHLAEETELDQRLVEIDQLEAFKNLAPGKLCDEGDPLMCKRFLVYTRAVQEMRKALASVLDVVQNSESASNTLVVFYSDHGEAFHDHLDEEAADGSDPRGYFGYGHGQSLYQEVLHVPLMVWHPEAPGRIFGEFVSLVDVMPGIIDWQGGQAITGSGLSLASLVREDEAIVRKPLFAHDDEGRRPLFASGIAYGAERIAVFEGKEKTIWQLPDDRISHFQLSQDENEQRPVPGLPDELTSFYLARYKDLVAVKRQQRSESLSHEELQRLKSIGYLQGLD